MKAAAAGFRRGRVEPSPGSAAPSSSSAHLGLSLPLKCPWRGTAQRPRSPAPHMPALPARGVLGKRGRSEQGPSLAGSVGSARLEGTTT